MELLRGIGELLRTGWMPKRQIILASFDAEEYGLVGSTTWMNKNEFALKHHALAYLYIGASVLGKSPKLTISTSDALSALLVVATKFVEHPVIADVENDTAHVVPTLDDIISPNKVYEQQDIRRKFVHRKWYPYMTLGRVHQLLMANFIQRYLFRHVLKKTVF